MRKSGGSLKKSGWHRINGYRLIGKMREDWTPSAWDRLLRELGISDAVAVGAVLEISERGEKLRGFVERELERSYIPEAVLDALGLMSHVAASVELSDGRASRGYRRH